MKKIFTICLIAGLSFSSRNFAISQCNPTDLVSSCPANIPSGFTFVKSYDLNLPSSASKKVEKSYVFSKDMTYSLAMCKGDQDIVVKIFDSNRREVASNSYENKVLPSFGFKCGATGIYYMAFTSIKEDLRCSAAVLAFKK
jgi:hypothetical protein